VTLLLCRTRDRKLTCVSWEIYGADCCFYLGDGAQMRQIKVPSGRAGRLGSQIKSTESRRYVDDEPRPPSMLAH
jgi:hypothetical protein